MKQNLDKIENTYNTLAKEWAEAFYDEHEKKPKDREVLKRFSQEIGNKQPVWDFGCGPGNTTSYLTKLGVDISGLDLSEKILGQAKTNYPGIHFQKGNFLELEFENDLIAGIVAFYAIVHLTEEQVRIAFQEIYRVLQPGGIFLSTFHIGEETIHIDEFLGKKVDMDFMFFSTDFIYNCLMESGFEKIELIKREAYPEVEYESHRAYVFARKPILNCS